MNDDGDFDVLSQAQSAAVKTVSEQRDLSVDTVVTAMLSGAAKVLAFQIDTMPDKREEYTGHGLRPAANGNRLSSHRPAERTIALPPTRRILLLVQFVE